MLTDFFTKPLQGGLFRFFRSIIMGYAPITDILNLNGEIKERVENWDKFKYEMISNIEPKVSPSDVRTVTSVRGEESDKKVSFEDTSVRTSSTPRNGVPSSSTYRNNKAAKKPTYAQIASRAKNNKPMLIN